MIYVNTPLVLQSEVISLLCISYFHLFTRALKIEPPTGVGVENIKEGIQDCKTNNDKTLHIKLKI